MVGRPGWRRSAAFTGGIALTAAGVFAVAAVHTSAGSLMTRVRSGIRLLAGEDPQARHVTIEAKSPRLLAEEADQRARKVELMQWGLVDFDPLKGIRFADGTPPELASPARELPMSLVANASDDVDYWLIQSVGSAGALRDKLEKAGIPLLAYIPNRAYLARLDGAQVKQVQATQGVRWIGRNLPAWKLDPDTLAMVSGSADPSTLELDSMGLVRIAANVYKGVDEEVFEAYVEDMKALRGVQVLDAEIEPSETLPRRVLLGVDPAVVADVVRHLAMLRDVQNVLSTPPAHFHNDHAVWFIQSGNDAIQDTDYDVSAPLFRKGLTGRGLIGAVEDDGLENDMCQYRYSSAKNDAAYPIGPRGRDWPPDEQPLNLDPTTVAPVYTRERKVVGYFVMLGAAAYSSPVQHGSGVAGCMAGDNNSVLAARPLVRDINQIQYVRGRSNGGQWTLGQELRPDLLAKVDTLSHDVGLPGAGAVQHHQSRDGMAPGAQILFQDIGDGSGGLQTNGDPPTAVFLQASRAGASVHNASFGGLNTCPALNCYLSSASIDDVLWYRRDLTAFVSAGNDGDQGAGSISQGLQQSKSEIVVGWSDRANTPSCPPCTTTTPRRGESMNPFSSKGPKSGGLLAPEVVFPGTVITAVTVDPNGNADPQPNPETGSGASDGGCGPVSPQQAGGTSFASPVGAGAGLLVTQYFWDGYYPTGAPRDANGRTIEYGGVDGLRPTNALVRAVLVNSARDLGGARTDMNNTQGHRPNFVQGWGAPRLDDTLYFEGDPKRTAGFDTERARLIVLTDIPNGYDGTGTLAPEPGGKTRDALVKSLKAGLQDNSSPHEFQLDVVNDTNGDGSPDPDDPANELRFTLAWSDVVGNTGNAPQVNNLDLEVVSPGPDGVLESSTATGLVGDDVVYRPKPANTNWVNGYTQPSPDQAISLRTGAGAPPPFSGPYTDTDMLNTVENVFIRSQDVVAGTWLVRVVPRDVPAVGGTSQGYPNYVAGDVAPTRDTDGDGANDLEEYDFIRGSSQGYALIASGNFTTNQGLIAINKANFGCVDERLSLTLNDQNGDSFEPGCTGDLQAIIKTTTPGPAFPSDREVAKFVGTQPVYRSQNQVTGGPDFEVRLVRNPADVIFGDGIIEVAEGETIFAEYVDQFPCGGSAFAQATVSCRPAIGDQGFLIADGCDYAAPGDPASGVRPDGFMDAGELNRYQLFISNDGGADLHDVVVNLYPDPVNANARYVDVQDSPRYIGYMPPGRIADATFLVKVDQNMPPQWQMDMIIEVTSPRDGYLFPVMLRQTQIFEADVISYRYDTCDPNGELYGKGKIEVLKPGVTALPGNANPPSDYVVNEPMWYDPDVPGNTAANCRVSRAAWPDAYVPPLACDRTSNQNPTDPWDFDDDPNADPDGPGDGWFEAAHDGDDGYAGVDFPFLWDWKSATGGLPGDSAASGGGCGWEDQLHAQLVASTLPATHPDKAIQPFGIWHTGAINQTNAGPYAGNVNNTDGVPFYDNPNSRLDHTIMWDPQPTGGADDNSTGQWCNKYFSDPNAARDYYRSMLIAPRLYRVHASRPEYRVEFQDLQIYTRLDAHTINGRNLAAAGWFINNQPVNPSTTTPVTYTWDQFQYYTNIFSDRVRPEWDVDDNTLNAGLARPSATFPQYTYEDIFGPAATSWNIALGWIHEHFDLGVSAGQYGWGVDDVSFIWTESRDDVDRSDCTALVGGQPPIVWFGENRYNACEGTLRINLWAPAEVGRRDPVAVAVTSAAEDYESALLYFNPATNRFEGEMRFTTDTRNDAVGVLLTSSGSYDTGNGTDTIRVEYDPATTNIDGRGIDADPATAADVRADWCDVDGNGINDDTDNDGIPDCEDDPSGTREVSDVSVINCTSGRLFYVKSELQQVGPGDGDRFADPGETQMMKVYLVSGLGADLENVDVKISTNDPVCLITDTVHMDLLPGNSTVVDTGFGFEFAVPQGMRTTDLDNPRTVTFRIDVRGRNTSNLNEFSTAGESFLTFLPMEAWMLVDVDSNPTAADFVDNAARGGRPVPPTGTWFEGFDGDALSYGLDHLFGERIQPGFDINKQLHDSETDKRFGMDGNSGFCPECDVQNDCAVTGAQPACDYYFSTQLTPGYPSTPDLPWNWTQDWAHNGTGSYKFGKNNASPTTQDQHYPQGVYASMTMPPIRIAANAVNPELTFWHIADIWHPNFTGGLSTPIDGAIVEIAPSASGVGDTGSGDDKVNRSTSVKIAQHYPISNFRRISPYVSLYDDETDALNACRTLFCRYHHPVFSAQGSPIDAPTPADGREGIPGTPGTWEQVKVDLSDYRGMEVVIQFSAEVLQDLEVQNGSLGWFLDQIQVTGVSQRKGIKLQTTHITDEPCALTADFAADDPGCFGSEIQFLDRHTGVGTFAPAVPPNPAQPYPIEYEWRMGTLVLRGLGGDLIPAGTPGVFGTYDNPRINLRTAAGISSPQAVPVTLNLYQNNGTSVVLVDSLTRSIVYKDAPVPTSAGITVSPAFVGGSTQISAIPTFDATLDPDRTLYWEWDFGDNTAVDTSGGSVEHVYAATGTYTITLRLYDEEGCTSTTTKTVNVTASPRYGSPAIVPAADPDCGTPFDDGNADIEEVVTVNVDFANSVGAATGTNIVGYLTSPDPLVEIVQGVANFDVSLAGGARSLIKPFKFIRHNDGAAVAPACLVVPFQLTLLSNGGTVTQVLDLSFTMGTATNTSFDNTGAQSATFCAVTGSSSSTDPNVSYTSTQGGCLNGLRLTVDVSAIGTGKVSQLKLTIYSPDQRPHVVLYEGEGPNGLGPYTIDFEFGADNGFGPIANHAGQLVDTAGNLSDVVKADLVSGLVGTQMVIGTTPWRVVASTTTQDTDCRSSYRINIREFQLEGSNSSDLEIGNVVACPSACFPTTAPVFAGAFFDCSQPGRLLFSPASDASLCNGVSDVTYELYASTVAGQLGTRVDGTAKELNPATQSCAANCPTGDCAMQNPLDATFWDVCNTTTVFWTVIAVDGGGARTPNITSPPATTPVPAPYQTQAVNCDRPVEPGLIGIVKGNGTMTMWLVPPVLPSGAPTFPDLYPPPYAREYRILRGTLPRTSTMADRDGDGVYGPVIYDHTGYVCAFVTTQRDISVDLATPGSFYYFVPGVNSLGCGGMGKDSELNNIPGAGTGCPTSPDCGP